MRTILLPLLAIYALVSTAYFIYHSKRDASRAAMISSRPRTSNAGLDGLPVPPPFTTSNSEPAPEQNLIARAQLQNELRYTDLESFICSESMERYKGRLNGENPRLIDTVNTRVSFENGVESYAAIQQNKRQLTSLSTLPGAWSEGEFGTLLRQSRTLLGSQSISIKGTTTVNGEAATIYHLDVPGEESPWALTVEAKSYRIPFGTDITVSQATGRISEISRVSAALPPECGISEIQWSVFLQLVQLDGKDWLLPINGLYSVLYRQTNHREWNVIKFTDYHRYTATSTMHF